MRVEDLHKKHTERVALHRRIYHTIYERCVSKIRTRNDLGDMQTTFHVPPLVLGEPRFDPARAAQYVVLKLRRNGFRAWVEDTVVHIDWRIDKTRARKYREEIRVQENQRDTVTRTEAGRLLHGTGLVGDPGAETSDGVSQVGTMTITLPSSRIESRIKQLSGGAARP